MQVRTQNRVFALIAGLVFAVVLVLACTARGEAQMPMKTQAEVKADNSFGGPHFDGNAAEPAGVDPNSWRYTGNGYLYYQFTVPQGDEVTGVTARVKNGANSGSSVFVAFHPSGFSETTAHTLGYANRGNYVEVYRDLGPFGPGTYQIGVRGGSIDAASNDRMILDWVRLEGTTGPVGTDSDADGVLDANDNCPNTPNAGQQNQDGDAQGDACDSDRDGDGRPNDTDYAPDDPNVQDPPPSGEVAADQEGESFNLANASHTVVNDAMYSGGQALKIADTSGTSTKQVSLSATGDVKVTARGGSSGGFPALQLFVDGSPVGSPQTVTGDLAEYTFDVNVPAGTHTIGLNGDNVATGRNLFVDKVEFPASDGTPPPTDTDGDGVPDSTDNCDNVQNPGQADSDGDGIGDACDSPDPDTQAPTTSIDSGPAEGSTDGDGNVSFGFSGSDNVGVTGFETKLVRGTTVVEDWTANSSGAKTYSGLSNGSYTFSVRAKDAAGNTDASPATRNFSVNVAASNTWTWPSSADVTVQPGDDIDAKVNGAAAGSTIKVFSDGDGEYTYNASQRLDLKQGTKLYAEPGTFSNIGSVQAKDVNPAVAINANFTADEAMQLLQGSNTIKGFELTGLTTADPGSQNCAGKGMFLAGGDTPNHDVQYNLFKDNPSLGAANIRGIVHNNEFDSNGSATWAQGCNGGGMKSRFEMDAAFNYVHDHSRGNGLWTDNGTEDDPNLVNDSWIRNNVTIRNGAAGIRVEETPDINPSSDPFEIRSTVENNISAGNSTITGRADIHVHDSANVLVRNNDVGPQSITGVGSVPLGGNNNGIRVSDSCRSDRPDTGDPTYGPVEVRNNVGHGDTRLLVEEQRYNQGDIIVSGNTGLPLDFEGSATGCQ